MLYFQKLDWQVTHSIKEVFQYLPDWTYSIEIKPARKVRSIEQNNLYWLRLEIISQTSGYTTDELHTLFKKEFLKPRKIICKTDKRKRRTLPATTTTLDTKDFCEYNDKIEIFARDFFNIVF